MALNIKDYCRALARYKATLAKTKADGTATAVDLLIDSDALTEMERELRKNASGVVSRWGQDARGPAKWLKHWSDFFSKKYRPQDHYPTRYRKKHNEYVAYASFQKQRSKLWRRHIIDYKNNTHWVNKFSSQLKAAIKLSI